MSAALSVLCALNLAGLLLIWFLQTWVAERWWLSTLLTYIPQWPFAPLTLLLMITTLFTRRRKLAALNAVAVMIVIFPLLGFRWAFLLPARPVGAGKPLRILTM